MFSFDAARLQIPKPASANAKSSCESATGAHTVPWFEAHMGTPDRWMAFSKLVVSQFIYTVVFFVSWVEPRMIILSRVISVDENHGVHQCPSYCHSTPGFYGWQTTNKQRSRQVAVVPSLQPA